MGAIIFCRRQSSPRLFPLRRPIPVQPNLPPYKIPPQSPYGDYYRDPYRSKKVRYHGMCNCRGLSKTFLYSYYTLILHSFNVKKVPYVQWLLS